MCVHIEVQIIPPTVQFLPTCTLYLLQMCAIVLANKDTFPEALGPSASDSSTAEILEGHPGSPMHQGLCQECVCVLWCVFGPPLPSAVF